jgi:hypothetical protein
MRLRKQYGIHFLLLPVTALFMSSRLTEFSA